MSIYTRDNFDEIVQAMRGARPGTFFLIRGYSSDTHPGESADYWCQFGVNYGNILRMDVDTLSAVATGPIVEAGKKELSVRVEHGAWVDAKYFEGLVPSPNSLVSPEPTANSVYGTLTRTEYLEGFRSRITTEGHIRLGALKPIKSHDRVYVRVSYEVKSGHPLLDKAVETMLAALRKRLDSFGEKQKRVFHKECRGGYTLTYRRGSLYIRQALVTYKVVRRNELAGDQQACSPLVAVKNALEQALRLRTGKFRSFIVSRDDESGHRFESLAMGGSVVLPWATEDLLVHYDVPVNASADGLGEP